MLTEQVGDGADHMRLVRFDCGAAEMRRDRRLVASPKVHEKTRKGRYVLNSCDEVCPSKHVGSGSGAA